MQHDSDGGKPTENHALAIYIRPARRDDVPTLVGLCAEHAEYERAAFDPNGKTELLDAALFSNPARLHAWIAWTGDRALGYATASREFSTWAAREYLHLDCLFLRVSVRGYGVGAALLHTAVAAAVGLGMEAMEWQTPDWNEAAIKFYRRLGAQEKAKMRFSLALEKNQESLRGSSPITLGVPT